MSTRLVLFGTPRLVHDGQSFVLPFERRHQLLVLLALRRTWVGRAELAAMLWPRQAATLAHSNLRKTLFRLQPLPWAGRLQQAGPSLRFDAAVDVHEFDAALREGRLAEALPLRQGELLAGFEDDANEPWTGWLGFERERLRSSWRGAVLERLAQPIDATEALRLAGELLEADPLDEAALRAQVSWLMRHGQAARARQVHHAFVARLEQELGIAPSAELAALLETHAAAAGPQAGTPMSPSARHTGESAPSSPARGAPPAAPGDDFVGRAVELRRIGELLASPECRLLTLLGPGGVGKTRLARRVLQDVAANLGSHPDGAVFVELEDLAPVGELAQRLARELGLAAAGGREPLDQVAAFVHDRRMLLVLDNFEHLLAEAAVLQRLLQACPRLSLLVTSRVRLALEAEHLFPLEGLPCPEPDDEDRLEAFDAVRLFVRTARRVEPAIVPAAEAAAIVDICRQVEGLPLALELAAAWTRVLSCEAIADELRNGVELLRSEDAARPARHASLELVFEHSWRLLTERERAALARLSVFRGGFTPDAAKSVAGAALPVLAALTDKSLLRKEGGRAGGRDGGRGRESTRGVLHPLVHQLAGSRLEDEDRTATLAAHARHFHRLLAQLRPAVENGDRLALDQVQLEFENCRAAWAWAIEQRATNALAQCAPALMNYCDHRGSIATGVALLRQALESPAVSAQPALEASLLASVAHLHFRLDQHAEAQAAATRAVEAARRLRDHAVLALGLSVLGARALRGGEPAEARRWFAPALKAALAGGQRRRAAAVQHNLGLIERATGRREAARALLLESMAGYQTLGDVAGEAMCLTTLATLHWDAGELPQASARLLAALEICDRHGLDRTRTVALSNLAALAIESGDHAAARRWGRRALEIAEATGNRHFAAWMHLQFASIALQERDLALARGELRVSLEIALSMGQVPPLLEALAVFSDLLAASGEMTGARRLLAFVVEHPSMATPDSEGLRKRLDGWSAGAPALPAWPGLELDELVHRIVAETPAAHAPLIALLRGPA